MQCNSCQALMINNVFCHETGCPNTDSRFDAEAGDWIRQRECRQCSGSTVDADEPCCEDADSDTMADDRLYYIGVLFNVNDETGAVEDYQISDMGLEYPDYWQGFGCWGTEFDRAQAGCGADAREALEDAVDSMAQAGHTVEYDQWTAMLGEVR